MILVNKLTILDAKLVKNNHLPIAYTHKKTRGNFTIGGVASLFHYIRHIRYFRFQVTKKRGSRCFTSDSLLGGGYLRLPASLTIDVVTLRALCQERDEVSPSRGDR